MGFFTRIDEEDGILKGKGLSALRNSKSNRNTLINLFGGVENLPSSVMRAQRPNGKVKRVIDEPSAIRGYENSLPESAKEKLKDSTIPDILRSALTSSGKGCGSGALSVFPQNIGRAVTLLYSEQGQTVFDPFAGHNSRMELCVRLGRHYVGCDLSTDFMKFNRKRAHQLRKEFPKTIIELHHGDSRKVPVASKSADFTLTSPPYYDIEYYGDEPEQLGKCKTYEDFLDGLALVMRENYRVLRRGSFAVWFINDFRQNGKFHLYHVDVIRLGEQAGFTTHDLMVVDLGRSIADCFTNQVIARQILPKRHEYGIVFRKPLKK